MNKNSKQDRAALAKAKQTVVCQRLRSQPGGSLTTQKFELHYGVQARLSRKAKVGAGKNPQIIKNNEE